jgi:hypothetical protein
MDAALSPALPYMILIAGLAVAALLTARGALGPKEIGEIVVATLTILAGVVIVMIFVGTVCMNTHPYEQFAVADSLDRLWSDIAAAETASCKLITRTDAFIKSDVGKPGQEDPSLVTAAQERARSGLSLVDCGASWSADVSDAAVQLSEAENRISRLEATLNKFTGPEIKKIYDNTVPCEGFATAPTLPELRVRLDAVLKVMTDQQMKLLKPIDDKTAQMQRGEVSDCEKRRGAKVGATAKS